MRAAPRDNLAALSSAALVLMREHAVQRLPVVLDSGELCVPSPRAIFDVAEAPRRIRVDNAMCVMRGGPVTMRSATSLQEAALLMIEDKSGGLSLIGRGQRLFG